MSETFSLSDPSGSPYLCNSHRYFCSSRRGHSSLMIGKKSLANSASSACNPHIVVWFGRRIPHLTGKVVPSPALVVGAEA